MKSTALILSVSTALTGVALLAAGCGKKSAPDTLARVGGQEITVADFKAELRQRIANRQNLPDRQTLLGEMITRATLLQRARAAGLENAPDVRRTVEDVLIAKLKETELDRGLGVLKVSAEEIRAAYERDAAQFCQPAKAQLAFVFLAADPKWAANRLDEVAARAREARRLALGLPATEKGFGPVAANFSEDQISRYRGGDGGWFTSNFTASRWPNEVIAAGLDLKNNGDISEVVRAADGFYLVKKTDSRPAVNPPLAQVQSGIEHRLLAAKRARLEAEFRQVPPAVSVQINLQLLSTVDYPTRTIGNAALPPSLPASP